MVLPLLRQVTAVADAGGKSLKEEYRWQLRLILAANALLFYLVAKENAIRFDGVRAAFTNLDSLLPVGLTAIAATVVNGLLSERTKDRLVFWRWRFPLPGHRAFSKHAPSDPRVDLAALRQLCGGDWPEGPENQNTAWYAMYKSIEDDPAIRQVQRDYLLTRDYAGMSVLFLVFFGAVGLFTIQSVEVWFCYFALLLIQYLVVRHSAANYAVNFVTAVLARKAATARDAGIR